VGQGELREACLERKTGGEKKERGGRRGKGKGSQRKDKAKSGLCDQHRCQARGGKH